MLPLVTHIGAHRIEPNLVLAPMEGVTDLTFRRLIRQIGGAGLTVTEFVASSGLKRGDCKMQRMAMVDPDEHPVSIQLYGREPQAMAEGARIVVELGADIVDINMGCPSKKVCSHSGGSALMKDLDRARDVVRQVVAAVDVPVTVKMRSGFDAQHRNAPELAWICQEEGASAVAIHWRTREDRYGGQRQVDAIARAKARLQIPVFGNGDVVDVPSAEAMFRDTGCDGLLIGRGAIKNPWLMLQLSQWQRGEPLTVVGARERKRVMLDYLQAMRVQIRTHWTGGQVREAAVDSAALGRLKMLANQYCRPLPHGRVFRQMVLRSQHIAQATAHIERYFDWLEACEASGVDEKLFPFADADGSEGRRHAVAGHRS